MDLTSATPVVYFFTADRDRALAFYADKLGMTLRSSDPFGDFLHFGDALARMTVKKDHQGGPYPLFGWNVEDATAAARALKAKGVDLIVYEGMGQDDDGVWAAPDGKTKVGWFADPDGNLLSISQA